MRSTASRKYSCGMDVSTSGVRTVGTGTCARYRLRIRGKEGTSESEREHLQRADFPSERLLLFFCYDEVSEPKRAGEEKPASKTVELSCCCTRSRRRTSGSQLISVCNLVAIFPALRAWFVSAQNEARSSLSRSHSHSHSHHCTRSSRGKSNLELEKAPEGVDAARPSRIGTGGRRDAFQSLALQLVPFTCALRHHPDPDPPDVPSWISCIIIENHRDGGRKGPRGG